MLLESLSPSRHAQARSAVVGGALLLTSGFARAADPEPVATRRDAIIGGQPSPTSQNAVVVVITNDSWCTGTVVSPTLVMTARHCVYSNTDKGPLNLKCAATTGGAPIEAAADPAEYKILVGNKHALAIGAQGKRLFGGGELDFCRNDIALLELDEPLEIAPLPLRLDAPAVEDERGIVVGWGRTEREIDGPTQLTDQRWQLALQIRAVGPSDISLENGGLLSVPASTFVTDQGGCMGDDGAPFIALETGAVVGVLGALEPGDPTSDPVNNAIVNNCLHAHTEFRDLISQRDWIRAAFAETGQTPWLEGFARPAALGAPCQSGPDCSSGLCAITESGGFCSDHCESEPCPQSMQCVGPEQQRLCVPRRLNRNVVAASGSCAMAAAGNACALWAALPFLALAFARHRRLRFRSMHYEVRLQTER